MPISIERASIRDEGFIFSLAQNGARHGHFDPKITEDKAGYRAFIHKAITQGVDSRGYLTEFSIIYLRGERIGVLLITAAIGTPDRGIELSMITLKKEFRGEGYAAQILDTLLSHYLPTMSVYARCYPASHRLHQMLLRRGFSEVGMSQASVILRHGAIGLIADQVPKIPAQPIPITL